MNKIIFHYRKYHSYSINFCSGHLSHWNLRRYWRPKPFHQGVYRLRMGYTLRRGRKTECRCDLLVFLGSFLLSAVGYDRNIKIVEMLCLIFLKNFLLPVQLVDFILISSGILHLVRCRIPHLLLHNLMAKISILLNQQFQPLHLLFL